MSSWKRRKEKLRKRRKMNGGARAIKPRIKVAVLIPACDMCNTGFALSLAHMIGVTYRAMLAGEIEPIAMTVNSYGTSILPFSRQVLAKTALEQGATHMLWIDSDMEFPGDMLIRFLGREQKIVGINAMSRRKPYRNTAQTAPAVWLSTTPNSTGLQKVFRMGFGVVWVASEVFEKMELPWFDFEWAPELSVFRGEDYVFFEKARKLGYEPYVDHDLSKQVFHNGQFGFNPLLMSEAEARGMIDQLSQNREHTASQSSVLQTAHKADDVVMR